VGYLSTHSSHQTIPGFGPRQPYQVGRVRPTKSMLTEDKANRVHNSGRAISALMERTIVPRDAQKVQHKNYEIIMFPETDELSNIISDTITVVLNGDLWIACCDFGEKWRADRDFRAATKSSPQSWV
jgi:hypothetical protein